VRLGAQRLSKVPQINNHHRFLLILIACYDWIAARNARTVVWKQRLETRRRYQSIIRSNSKRIREKQNSSSFPRFDTWKFTRYWRWRQVDATRLSTFNSGRNQPHSATASLPLSDTVRRSTIAVSNCTRRDPRGIRVSALAKRQILMQRWNLPLLRGGNLFCPTVKANIADCQIAASFPSIARRLLCDTVDLSGSLASACRRTNDILIQDERLASRQSRLTRNLTMRGEERKRGERRDD